MNNFISIILFKFCTLMYRQFLEIDIFESIRINLLYLKNFFKARNIIFVSFSNSRALLNEIISRLLKNFTPLDHISIKSPNSFLEVLNYFFLDQLVKDMLVYCYGLRPHVFHKLIDWWLLGIYYNINTNKHDNAMNNIRNY